MVEHHPFKVVVEGSIPSALIYLRPHGLARSKTPGFHPGNRGSNPLGDAIF